MTAEHQDDSMDDQRWESPAGQAGDEEFEPMARRLAQANAEIEPPPALIDRIESRIAVATAQRRTWRNTGLATAAVVSLAVTAWVITVLTSSPLSSPPVGDHLAGNDEAEPQRVVQQDRLASRTAGIADNSDDMVYGIGWNTQTPFTRVSFDSTPDDPRKRQSSERDAERESPGPQHDEAIAADPPDPEPTLDDLLDRLQREVLRGDPARYLTTAQSIGRLGNPRAIPDLIGILDTDNSHDTIYRIGWYALTPLTGVRYDDTHHGPWWRKWWEANAARYDEDVRRRPIPEFPKTGHGEAFAANPPDPASIILEPTLDDLLERLQEAIQLEDIGRVVNTARWLGEFEDPRAIPALIGILDSDNSHATIYRIGWFALTPLTGVRFDYTHHGPWWRQWWKANSPRYDEEVRRRPIPEFPKTKHGKAFAANPPDPASIILEPTLDDLLERLEQSVENGDTRSLDNTARWIAEFENPRAIPKLIELIERDNTQNTIYQVGWYGLSPLTQVEYEEVHDGPWWRQWWAENRADVEAKIADARKREPPSGDLHVANHERTLIHAEDVADIPAVDRRAQNDPYKRYILIGQPADQPAPPQGYKVLLVLPGGPGTPDFHPFVKRIYRNVLSDEYLLAQIVAPEWDRQQAQKLVWPTTTNPHRSMKFSTEQFIDAVLDEIDQDYTIDQRYIFVLAWSSSGPATYAIALQPNTRVTGAFVAMSVFKPQTLPPIEDAAGLAFYILHSPQDRIPIKHAETARDQLRAAGARTKLTTYEGGHGWRGNVYQNMRDGIRWLQEQVKNNTGVDGGV